MYKIILVFTFFLASVISVPAQWTEYPLHEEIRPPMSTFFINSEIGFIGQDAHSIWKTTNSGKTWFKINLGSKTIQQLSFITPEVGFGSGGLDTNCIIYKTTNGGLNWKAKFNLPHVSYTARILKIYCYSQQEIVVVGTNGLIFISHNVGESWERIIINIPTNANWLLDTYISESKLFILSDDPVNSLLMTSDYGQSWISRPVPIIGSEMKLINNVSYIVGKTSNSGMVHTYPLIARSVDEWSTWSTNVLFPLNSHPVGYAWVGSIGNINNTTYVLGGERNPDVPSGWAYYLYYSRDNGLNWTRDVNFPAPLWGGYGPMACTAKNIFIITWDGVGQASMRRRQFSSAGFINKENEDNIDTQGYSYNLTQNYPNAFNPVTTITYSIANPTHVNLTVYDITGKQVAILVDKEETTGEHQVNFDASTLSSGTYFYRLTAKDFTDTKKMMLIK